MKYYRVLTAKSPKAAEELMNDMAAEGREVKAVTFGEGPLNNQLLITFERDI